MIFYERASSADVTGTSLIGYLDTTYADLVGALGEPHDDGDGDKVDAEWRVMTAAGPATIYNYKTGVNHLGEGEGKDVEDIRDWHVGGRHKGALVELARLLGPAAGEVTSA